MHGANGVKYKEIAQHYNFPKRKTRCPVYRIKGDQLSERPIEQFHVIVKIGMSE